MQEKAEQKDPNKVIYIKQEGPVDPYIPIMKYLARKEEEFGAESINYKSKIS